MKGSIRATPLRGLLLAPALVLLPAGIASAVVVPPLQQAVDDTLVTDQDTSASILVTENDDVPNGFEIAITTNPAHGQVLPIRPTPAFYQYVPAAGFSGSDSFRYRLTFDDGSTSFATVSITVRPVAKPTTTTTTTTRRTTTTTTTTRRTTTTTRRTTTTTTRRRTTTTSATTTTAPAPTPPTGPQAVDDSAAADFGAAVTVAVLTNDRGTLVPGTVTIVRAPEHGTATAAGDGTVTYTSTGDAAEFADTFRYRVADTAGRTTEADVTVKLREPDDLLDGDTSSVPGGTLRVTGRGCVSGDAVRLTVDGDRAGEAAAGADGTFTLTVLAPERLGRYRVRAVCPGHTLQSWLDVVQTTTERSATTPAAAAALATVGVVLAFWLLSGFVLAVPTARR